jgi:hypothetical protein
MSSDQPADLDGGQSALSRRRFVATSAAVAVVTPIVATLGLPAGAAYGADADAEHIGTLAHPSLAGPLRRAYNYLDAVMDAYVTGDEPRLLQSYNNESGLMTSAFGYDNALAVIAYLARPTRRNVNRARVLGDTLLWIQAHDETFTDGRLRQAYAAGPMMFYGGSPSFTGIRRDDGHAAFMWPFGFSGSAVGDVAWVGLALARLYAHTRERRYLDGAVALGCWIADHCRSPYRYGGYHGGVQADGVTPQRWTSTEHNVDAYALFRALGRFTAERAWRDRAQRARTFVQAMWHPAGFFYTGTQGVHPTDDPNLVNRTPLPEDVNTWSYLALRERAYERAVDWAADNLANTDRGGVSDNSQVPAGQQISGVAFSDATKILSGTVPDSTRPNVRDAVWLEGNGHLAAALLARDGRRGRGRSDRERAADYLRQVVAAQEMLGGGQTVGRTADPRGGQLSDPGAGGTWTGGALPARSGVVAASSAFHTGFTYGYFQRQHVGATSWFVIAAQRVNPFQF